MTSLPPRRLAFTPKDGEAVSALLLAPDDPRALYVFAHGAGANMEHAFMEAMAQKLAQNRIATFRYNFPYMEHRRGRPDLKHVLHRTVRAAVETARALVPDIPLIAGGKSMGGRMTSEAQAHEPLADVRALAFVGFPLHPPKKPSSDRAEHLARVEIPMLFLQGTRDDLASLELMHGVCGELGTRATLHVLEGADHSFHVLKRSGRTDDEVMQEMADVFVAWNDNGFNG
jgi:uncharacterized protein